MWGIFFFSCLSRIYNLLQIFNWPERQQKFYAQCACIWGGREGSQAQDFAKTEAGNSLCILAFLQETNVVFWDIKGPVCGFFCNWKMKILILVKLPFFFINGMFFNFYACTFKNKFIYKPYFFSSLVSSCSLFCMIKIWILFLEKLWLLFKDQESFM